MRKWKPSKAAAREYAEQMGAIRLFCDEHGIETSSNGDSYYFSINGKRYRVSNHTIEASNAAAYDSITGQQKRDLYHPIERSKDTVYIHAGKTRISQIYNDLATGFRLAGRGNRVL